MSMGAIDWLKDRWTVGLKTLKTWQVCVASMLSWSCWGSAEFVTKVYLDYLHSSYSRSSNNAERFFKSKTNLTASCHFVFQRYSARYVPSSSRYCLNIYTFASFAKMPWKYVQFRLLKCVFRFKANLKKFLSCCLLLFASLFALIKLGHYFIFLYFLIVIILVRSTWPASSKKQNCQLGSLCDLVVVSEALVYIVMRRRNWPVTRCVYGIYINGQQCNLIS